MKKIRRTLPALALLMLLNGCAAQEEILPSETMDVQPVFVETVPVEMVEETEIPVPEETIPDRESVDETQAASEPEPTKPQTNKAEEKKTVQSEEMDSVAVETEPAETVPQVTEPVHTEPAAAKPPVTEPEETVPQVTEPPETEPPAEVIDTSALEAYARKYAASTYGYNGNPQCTPATNAGYFPGIRTVVNTMEDGYAAAREAVDYQYESDVSMGRAICVEIDGVMVRRNINVYFEPTEDPNIFIVWCYYGGEA